MLFAQTIFWVSLAIPVYAYFGYPLLLILLRALIHRPIAKAPFEPTLTVLVPAYNEAAHIARKIQDVLSMDYPSGKLEILVACDGSRDDTPAVARSLADGTRVRVLEYPQNRGKISVLNDGVREARGEIVVFSDATALFYPNALRLLMRSFADPQVGAVSGRYTVVRAEEVGIGKAEDFYWKYEAFLKVQESGLHSMLGAHGHLHAIRRELYPYPPAGTINDDYIIPVSVLAKGFRSVYEPEAVVYEEAREMSGFGRRVRIMAGNLQQLRELKGLLYPFHALPLLFFLSHKVIRLVVPFAMVAALVSNLFLLDSALYRALLAGQVLFYGLALAGAWGRFLPKILLLPYYFSMINAAVFFGVYHTLTKRRRMSWK